MDQNLHLRLTISPNTSHSNERLKKLHLSEQVTAILRITYQILALMNKGLPIGSFRDFLFNRIRLISWIDTGDVCLDIVFLGVRVMNMHDRKTMAELIDHMYLLSLINDSYVRKIKFKAIIEASKIISKKSIFYPVEIYGGTPRSKLPEVKPSKYMTKHTVGPCDPQYELYRSENPGYLYLECESMFRESEDLDHDSYIGEFNNLLTLSPKDEETLKVWFDTDMERFDWHGPRDWTINSLAKYYSTEELQKELVSIPWMTTPLIEALVMLNRHPGSAKDVYPGVFKSISAKALKRKSKIAILASRKREEYLNAILFRLRMRSLTDEVDIATESLISVCDLMNENQEDIMSAFKIRDRISSDFTIKNIVKRLNVLFGEWEHNELVIQYVRDKKTMIHKVRNQHV